MKINQICIYDHFTELYHEQHLFPMELYLYSFLYVNRSYDSIVKTSVENIHQSMPVRFHLSREYLNRSLITECIVSLQKKGVIEFSVDITMLLDKKQGKYISLDITFSEIIKSGYIKVDYSDFYKSENYIHFYILNAVKRYDNVKYKDGQYGRWISEQEFGMLLGINKRTFKNYADDLISQNKLFKLTGKRVDGSKERDKNRYRTIPFKGRKENDYESRLSEEKSRRGKYIEDGNSGKRKSGEMSSGSKNPF